MLADGLNDTFTLVRLGRRFGMIVIRIRVAVMLPFTALKKMMDTMRLRCSESEDEQRRDAERKAPLQIEDFGKRVHLRFRLISTG